MSASGGLWAAGEARSHGRGGITATARATGMHVDTIREGMRELESGETLAPGRVRRAGGGRRPLTEVDPTLLWDLERLVDEEARGDPQGPLRWTAKSVRQIADALGELGHEVHFTSVAKLLRGLGYSLQANRKTKVCHFPPATSKWNKIEHRLFSFISINWRAKPLVSLEVIINLIAATTTRTGLEVYAQLDQRAYPDKVRVSDTELGAVSLQRAPFHPDWNYIIKPRT
jgi:transposase